MGVNFWTTYWLLGEGADEEAKRWVAHEAPGRFEILFSSPKAVELYEEGFYPTLPVPPKPFHIAVITDSDGDPLPPTLGVVAWYDEGGWIAPDVEREYLFARWLLVYRRDQLDRLLADALKHVEVKEPPGTGWDAPPAVLDKLAAALEQILKEVTGDPRSGDEDVDAEILRKVFFELKCRDVAGFLVGDAVCRRSDPDDPDNRGRKAPKRRATVTEE
jgi:hypothetical protein